MKERTLNFGGYVKTISESYLKYWIASQLIKDTSVEKTEEYMSKHQEKIEFVSDYIFRKYEDKVVYDSFALQSCLSEANVIYRKEIAKQNSVGERTLNFGSYVQNISETYLKNWIASELSGESEITKIEEFMLENEDRINDISDYIFAFFNNKFVHNGFSLNNCLNIALKELNYENEIFTQKKRNKRALQLRLGRKSTRY